ncbi:hypothetical protein [Halovenus halobia]|uniref:hypothetical protein n=1 Tax=Halovenus halobia TaxID=3396622 RepID=UPI003F55B68C
MDDRELLRRELRATREELVRKQARSTEGQPIEDSQLPLMPDRKERFLRIALMGTDELERHIERLERDLADLETGFEEGEDTD